MLTSLCNPVISYSAHARRYQLRLNEAVCKFLHKLTLFAGLSYKWWRLKDSPKGIERLKLLSYVIKLGSKGNLGQ